MTVERMIELLEIEKECVLRNASGGCNRYCAGCDLLQDDTELHEMYTETIALLKAQEPVAPVLQSGGNYVCGNCGMYTVGFAHPLTGERVQTWKYCGSCGKKVRWG